MTEKDISLGEFVKQLTTRIKDLPMPFKDERPWHLLFFRLKSGHYEGKPEFLKHLRFDWDGPYPRSQELSDYIHALHFTGCVSASNPSYDQMSLDQELRKLWSSMKLEGQLPGFVDTAMGIVKEEFASK